MYDLSIELFTNFKRFGLYTLIPASGFLNETKKIKWFKHSISVASVLFDVISVWKIDIASIYLSIYLSYEDTIPAVAVNLNLKS